MDQNDITDELYSKCVMDLKKDFMNLSKKSIDSIFEEKIKPELPDIFESQFKQNINGYFEENNQKYLSAFFNHYEKYTFLKWAGAAMLGIIPILTLTLDEPLFHGMISKQLGITDKSYAMIMLGSIVNAAVCTVGVIYNTNINKINKFNKWYSKKFGKEESFSQHYVNDNEK